MSQIQQFSDTEKWKDIPWYEWLYQASSFWNIKSLFYWKTWKPRNLIPWKDADGYVKVNLYKNNSRKFISVHRLVWITFFWENEWMQINHKNGIRNDNRVENLEWCTGSENQKHAWKFLWRVAPLKWKLWIDNPNSHIIKYISKDWKQEWIFTWIRELWGILWIPYQNIMAVCNGYRKQAWWFYFYNLSKYEPNTAV